MIAQALGVLGLTGAAGQAPHGPLASGAGFWFPPGVSSVSAESDWVYMFIFYLIALFFVLIVGVMGYFVWKYRRVPGRDAEVTSTHNTALEVTWSVIPSILVLMMFWYGW